MSTIGKVLVFLNLILAAAFLASSIFLLQNQENWKSKHASDMAANKKVIAEKDELVTKTRKELDDAKNAASNAERAAEAAKAAKEATDRNLSELTAYRDRTVNDIQKFATNLDNYRANNEQLTKQLDEANKSVTAMRGERDAAKKAQEDAENKMGTSDEGAKQLLAEKNSLMETTKKLTEDL